MSKSKYTLKDLLSQEGAKHISEIIDDFKDLEDDDKIELERIANKYVYAFFWFTDQVICYEEFEKDKLKEYREWNTEVFIRIIQEVEKVNNEKR